MLKPRHLMEAALFYTVYGCLRILPVDAASWAGEKIGQIAGQWLHGMNAVARINLRIAFPGKDDAAREEILRGMWKHLGRVAAEFSHLPSGKLFARTSFEGLYNLPPPGQPALFVSGHLGNWELAYPAAQGHGVPVTLIYRHANNPLIDRLIRRTRRHCANNMFPKGIRGAVAMAKALRNGESLALLIDQKMNEGLAVPFFGVPAMTAPAVAILALKYKMPIVPARAVRTDGVHFRVTVYPPLVIEPEDDAAAILARLHRVLEEWIREYPEQWLWIHRRWGKEIYDRGAASTVPS